MNRTTASLATVAAMLLLGACSGGGSGGSRRSDDNDEDSTLVGDTGGFDSTGGDDPDGGGGGDSDPGRDTDLTHCDGDSDCPGGHLCVGGLCHEICGPSDPCEGALVACDEEARICVACTSDGHCRGGERCVDAACVALCRSNEDCDANWWCELESGSCLPRECVEDGDCRGGEVCTGYVCVPFDEQICDPFEGSCVGQTAHVCNAGGTAWVDIDCAANLQICVASGGGARCDTGGGCTNGTTRCSGAGDVEQCAGGAWGVLDDCGAGETCNAELFRCESATGGSLCDACVTDSDCGGPSDDCVSVSFGERVCGAACTTSGDCPGGYACVDSGSGGAQCEPEGGTCVGCLLDGCGPGFVCDGLSGECVPIVPTCGACTTDGECGAGSACVGVDGEDVCLVRCGTCAAGSACQTVEGARVCVPSSGTCDGGTCGLRASDCPSDRPLVDTVGCRCVECNSRADCSTGQQCGDNGRCLWTDGSVCSTSAECTPDYCIGGYCVECRTATDCSSGWTCDAGRCTSESTCECDPGYHCDGGGNCVPDSVACSSDAQCETRAAAAGWTGGPVACDPGVGCFVIGGCEDVGTEADEDPWDAACSAATTCGLVIDLLGGGTFYSACIGCTDGDDSTCRIGETCVTPLFPFPGMDQPYCAPAGGP